jgi:hypothetical protein
MMKHESSGFAQKLFQGRKRLSRMDVILLPKGGI